MAKDRALINKLKRRKKSLRKGRGFRQIDKSFRNDEILADSPAAYKYLRGITRRFDDNFGQQMLPNPEKARKEVLVEATLERVDFGVSDFGIKMTLASGLRDEIGVQPDDIVFVLEGGLKGQQLKVISLESATEIRLEDVSTFSGPESNQACNIQISGTKISFS